MKANEIQIGDYVFHKDKVVKVDILTSAKPFIGVIDEHGSYTALEKDIEPIPITTEILEKNGIVYTGGGNIFEWKNKNEPGTIECIENKSPEHYISIEIHNYKLEPMTITGNFSYVHELQHA